MIVDVSDLNFESLNFNRSYDSARYRRGKNIYNNEQVQIESVDKVDEKNYSIIASVEGNYDTYTTTMKIHGGIINYCTCTCEDFYKGYLCKHIIATSMEVIEPHSASTKEGRAKLEKEKKEAERKALQEFKRRQKEEQRRIEYERKYGESLSILEKYKSSNSNDNDENSLDLKYLYECYLHKKDKREGNSATNVRIETIVEIQDLNTLKLSLKIGETQMYKLNNISDLYNAYLEKSEIYYGKKLRFIPKVENFDDDSKEMFLFIMRYAEMMQYNNSFLGYNMLSKYNKELLIKGERLEEFFNINKDKEFPLHSNYYNYTRNYRFCENKIELTCILKKEIVEVPVGKYWFNDEYEESEEYILRPNINNFDFVYTPDNIYLFYDDSVYKLDRTRKNESFFDLFKNDYGIIIPEEKLEEFKKVVLSKVDYSIEEKGTSEEDKKILITNDLASKILLDIDDDGNIILDLKFCYGNFEFNVLDKDYEKHIEESNIIRDIPAETDTIKRIFSDGFELIPSKKHFVMSDLNSVYEFLTNKIEGYMSDFEVLVTDKFKNRRITPPKISNIGVRVNNGLLELDLSKINIDLKELKDVLKDYKIKKKYYKLKNGDLLDLADNEDLNLLDEMQTTLDIDYGRIDRGIAKLPISRSMYLDNLIEPRKDITIEKDSKYARLIDKIQNGDLTNEIKIPENFVDKLRDYQKVGYKWLKTIESYKFGGILADDMGLGKTIQVIALLNSTLREQKHFTSIVVCPSTLVLNWNAEIQKWCNSLNVLVIKGTAKERAELLKKSENYDLIITSYDLLKRDVELYENKLFKYIIADEAQYIKNAATQNSTALKSLNGEIKFALTGTPIENSVSELWSIFDFIMPGYLYNYNKFKKKFEEPILKLEDKEVLIRLKKLISPFILRRTKNEVLTELPEKNITIMKNEMDKEQEKIYLSYLSQTQKELAQELSESSFEKSKFKILMLLTRLRQICCHPSLFIENYNGGSGKLDQCIDLVNEAISSGHKILLFSSYTSMFDVIEQKLNEMKIDYYKLIGSTPVGKRIELVDSFNKNKNVKVFLISLKAGGTGLNLTSADVVIHFDPWWNLSSENQATDRAYRIGQKNSVQVYKLITTNSIEEKINKMQEQKEKLSKDILSTEETFINKLSKEEILDLFS